MHPALPRSVFSFPWVTTPALSLLVFGALLGPLSTAQAASCEAQSSALLTPEASGWEPGEQIAPVFDTFVRVYFEGLITDAGRRALSKKGER